MASSSLSSAQPVTAQEGLAGFAAVISVYEHRIGHICRAVASHLPSLLPPSASGFESGSRIVVLDNACGTGAASLEMLRAFPHSTIHAADVMPAMVQSFQSLLTADPTLASHVTEVRVEDGEHLTYADNMFDLSITNLGLFFFADPVAGARQIYRTLKPGASAAVTVWKAFGFKPILWEVQRRVGPVDPLTELPLMEPWCHPGKVEGVLREAGFGAVNMSVVKEVLWGTDRADFILVLLQNFGAMVARNWTEEEKAKLAPVTANVVEEMFDQFCIKDGEKVGCMMEAWAAVCTK